jgi:hypothetical protein
MARGKLDFRQMTLPCEKVSLFRRKSGDRPGR